MSWEAADGIPQDVRAVVNRYVELADRALPGGIEGLYLVGSIALGDYRAGQSDIDFVAVGGNVLTERERERLRDVHAGLLDAVPKPWFDGIYVTWEDLRKDPTVIEEVPFSL